MVKVFREEPLFVKVRKPAQEFPTWIHLKVPQGRYKVNAPLQHRLICKEAQLIPECEWNELYSSEATTIDVLDYEATGHHLLTKTTTITTVNQPLVPTDANHYGYSTGFYALVSTRDGRGAEVEITAVDAFTRITGIRFLPGGGGSKYIKNEVLTIPPSLVEYPLWTYSTKPGGTHVLTDTPTPVFTWTNTSNEILSYNNALVDGTNNYANVDGGVSGGNNGIQLKYASVSGDIEDTQVHNNNSGSYRKKVGHRIEFDTGNTYNYLDPSSDLWGTPSFLKARTTNPTLLTGVYGGSFEVYSTTTVTQSDITYDGNGGPLNLQIDLSADTIFAQSLESGNHSIGYENTDVLQFKTGRRTNYIRRNTSSNGRNYNTSDADPGAGMVSEPVYLFDNNRITYPVMEEGATSYTVASTETIWRPSAATTGLQYVIDVIRAGTTFPTNTYNPNPENTTTTLDGDIEPEAVYELPEVEFTQTNDLVTDIKIVRQGDNYGNVTAAKNLQVGDTLVIPSLSYKFLGTTALSAFPTLTFSNAEEINTNSDLANLAVPYDPYLGTGTFLIEKLEQTALADAAELAAAAAVVAAEAKKGKVLITTSTSNFVQNIYLPPRTVSVVGGVSTTAYDGYVVHVKNNHSTSTTTKTTNIHFSTQVKDGSSTWYQDDHVEVLAPQDEITYVNVDGYWYSTRGGLHIHYTLTIADFTEQEMTVTLQNSDLLTAPQKMSMVLREADFIMPNPWSFKVHSVQTLASDKILNKSMGAPHNHLFLEATTASSVSSSHDMIYGAMESAEMLKNSTKFAKLAFGHGGQRYMSRDMSKIDADADPEVREFSEITDSPLWECNRDDEAYAFPLGCSDETSLHLRVSDCEGHGLDMLSKPSQEGQGALFRPEVMIELTISLLYQVFVQDVEMPQHPKEGFLGYYRNAITEPLSNI